MRTTIKIFSIISIVLGSFSILYYLAVGVASGAEAFGAFVGATWWIVYGSFVLSYLSKENK